MLEDFLPRLNFPAQYLTQVYSASENICTMFHTNYTKTAKRYHSRKSLIGMV